MNGSKENSVNNHGTEDRIKSTPKKQKKTSFPVLPDFDITAKIMLVGDSSVGKTCLLTKFRDDTFLSGSFICTVGIDFRNKIVQVDDTKVKLQVWDTAGQERFRSITRAYYRDAEALLLVYDTTSQTSFDNIRSWLTDIHEYSNDDVIMMLLGNKADLTNERVIKLEQGEKLAQESGIPFMETSAKSGLNVNLAFTALAKTLKELKCTEIDKDSHHRKSRLQHFLSRDSRGESGGCRC